MASSQSWSEEWRALGLGARLPKEDTKLTNLLFVQLASVSINTVTMIAMLVGVEVVLLRLLSEQYGMQ